jgi:ABC-type polysaccharide/polyol phosphate export permease
MLLGAFSEHSEIVEKLWHPVPYLLIPLSGSFFTVYALPPAARDIFLLNPTVNCNELLRAGFFGPGYEWFYSVGYVVVFNMVLTLLALAQVRAIKVSHAA